jgi:hypothetical protein
MRWGTGVVVEYLDAVAFGSTKGFATRFSIAKTRHEAQAAPGDSGGAAFARGVDRWELAGIILEIKGNSGGQPPRTAIYGNRTIIANLAHYREAIQQITGLLLGGECRNIKSARAGINSCPIWDTGTPKWDILLQ